MLSKPVAIGVLVVGCVTAAAGGAYIATRHQAASVASGPAATFSEPASADAAPATADPSIATPAAEPAPPVNEIPNAVQPAPGNPAKRRQVARTPIADARPNQRDATRVGAAAAQSEPATVPGAPLPEPETSALPTPGTALPQARLEEITVPSDTVIGVQVDTAVSSERARVEDRVDGRVTRDVAVGGRVAIPAGTRLLGSVTMVERGGKFKERARIAVRFHTAQLADGTRLPLQTTAIVRDGDSPTRESAAKVGGATVGGAILGAILGGGKGAMIGGTAGAAGGTAVVMAGDRNAATLPAGTTATVRLMSDATVTIEK